MMTNNNLNKSDYVRFGRQIMLPEIGVEGQSRIKRAKILLIGVGGLGSPLALYLVAAGIGEIGLVDDDVVDVSNLQRQVLFNSEDVGLPKVMCAKKHLQALNPDVIINTYHTRLNEENALDIVKQYDLVIDGTDNFQSRFLVNDACVLLGKPNIYASIFRFEGQATVFGAENGPCYRCLYPEPPPEGLVPSCGEIGVLGILPGIMACIQATEAIKWITNVGKPLSSRLLTYDAMNMHFQEYPLEKNPDCAICGSQAPIRELKSIEMACSLAHQNSTPEVQEILPQQLSEIIDSVDYQIVDVRDAYEREISNIAGSVNVPYAKLNECLDQLDRNKKIVVYCKYGVLSKRAALILTEHSFPFVYSLVGGIAAWTQLIKPELSEY